MRQGLHLSTPPGIVIPPRQGGEELPSLPLTELPLLAEGIARSIPLPALHNLNPVSLNRLIVV